MPCEFQSGLIFIFESERNCAHFLVCLSSGQMPMFILLLLFIAINSIASAIKALCLVYKYTVTEVFFGTFVNRATILTLIPIFFGTAYPDFSPNPIKCGLKNISRLSRMHPGLSPRDSGRSCGSSRRLRTCLRQLAFGSSPSARRICRTRNRRRVIGVPPTGRGETPPPLRGLTRRRARTPRVTRILDEMRGWTILKSGLT